ncbi:M20/M25/M40 family metallo-hydrolase [Reichenbachiella ulvae]|uniref:M20/M25/M40 family metallo-hydrolase n=1 Tax=Reichenbachiella ulvae TaxID=2980104 RepID=A0ABT3CQ64_9BACT|nr:M20/M25/M40 family metallo-hydrolase [Reichenbachiella ulvae]MCV9385654.1 M20/M25/M40 family metallo-hydrolase [Reichenbachiella ulvae]
MVKNDPYVSNLFRHANTIFELGFNPKGECSALAYTRLLYDRCEYFRKEMEALGMQTRYDVLGNLYGLLPGASEKKILVLSHLDSVFDAGRYDGVLGVILPLEYVRWLQDEGIQPRYSMEILVCMGEESPGVTATFGSKAITGHYSWQQLQDMTLAYDSSMSLPKAIQQFFGDASVELTREKLQALQLNPEEYVKALEVHIEQYLQLQNRAKASDGQPHIGVMRGVGGHIRFTIEAEEPSFVEEQLMGYELIIHGETGHSGATPMGEIRKDALVASAQLIMKLVEQPFPVKFGYWEVLDPSTTSIPDRVKLNLWVHPEHKSKLIALCGGCEHTDIMIQTTPSDLMTYMAQIVLAVDRSANDALDTDEVRATITKLELKGHEASCFCDVRGATLEGMKGVENATQIPTPNSIHDHREELSRKAPILFASTQMEEEVLNAAFEGRVMSGQISVPGQDIGVIASCGIDAALFFIESGTGHHPDEYVREEAMEQAFEATKIILNHWDKTLNS